MREINLTHARLQEAFFYDPITGIFTWRIDHPHARAGSIAGRVSAKGYRQIMVDGTRYYAGRLAWFWVYGVWPREQIDHRNGNKDDNAIGNLREATNGQNQANAGKYRNYADLPKGVTKVRGRYRGQIRAGGKQRHLGYFATADEAHAAYCAAAAKHFGEFARAQ